MKKLAYLLPVLAFAASVSISAQNMAPTNPPPAPPATTNAPAAAPATDAAVSGVDTNTGIYKMRKDGVSYANGCGVNSSYASSYNPNSPNTNNNYSNETYYNEGSNGYSSTVAQPVAPNYNYNQNSYNSNGVYQPVAPSYNYNGYNSSNGYYVDGVYYSNTNNRNNYHNNQYRGSYNNNYRY